MCVWGLFNYALMNLPPFFVIDQKYKYTKNIFRKYYIKYGYERKEPGKNENEIGKGGGVGTGAEKTIFYEKRDTDFLIMLGIHCPLPSLNNLKFSQVDSEGC